MKVGIIQSSYLPWRGYFDFIASVDLFVVYDDVQFSKGAWRNRNRIKTPRGLQWLTVPVRHRSLSQLICETEIDNSRNWRRDHSQSVAINYARAPYVRDVLSMLGAAFDAPHTTISGLNIALMRSVCDYLAIRTPLRLSAEVPQHGAKTERLVGLLRSVGATSYVSGPTGRGYLDEARFHRAGIRLEYKVYSYPEYPQRWGHFEGAVSVMDLLANCGPQSRDLLLSQEPNQAVAA